MHTQTPNPRTAPKATRRSDSQYVTPGRRPTPIQDFLGAGPRRTPNCEMLALLS